MKYIWDANILLNYVRQTPLFFNLNEEYRFLSSENDTYLSIVTVGEIYSLANQRDWKMKKRLFLADALKRFAQPLPIANNQIIQAYSKIDAYSQGKLKGQPLPKGMSARNMGKNDIWIAATAHALSLTLITTDKDFSHLNNVFCDIEQIEI